MTEQLRYRIDRPVYSYDTIIKDYVETDNKVNMKKAMKNRINCNNVTPYKVGKILFPLPFILASFYKTKFLLYDFISGLTMLVFHIPQGMAYGLLAGLEPVNGLYASFFPALVYALFGTSRHISIGTFSLMSLLAATSVIREINRDDYIIPYSISTQSTSTSQIINFTSVTYSPLNITTATDYSSQAKTNEEAFQEAKLQLAISTTLLAGIIQAGMGLGQFGFLMMFMSDALIDGFTTAAAFHVMMAQINHLLGYDVSRTSGIFQLPKKAFLLIKDLPRVNLATLIISVICIATLLLFSEWLNPIIKRKFKFPFPIQFLLVVLGTLISYLARLQYNFKVDIVGNIPKGLPMPQMPDTKYWPLIFTDAIILAILGFVMNAALAKVFALKYSYDVNFNQELVAYGLSNIVGSMFSCVMSAAALARTSVVAEVGMKSQLASLVSCFMMLFVLLFIGPLFQYVPKSVLAAIIIVSLKGLIKQLSCLPNLWHISKYDFWVWIVTFLATLILSIPYGLMIGFIFSLMTVMLRLQLPKYQVLGQLPGTDIYKNVKVFKEARELQEIKIIRYDAPLYFANAENFQSKIYNKTRINPNKIYQVESVISMKDLDLKLSGHGPIDIESMRLSSCHGGNLRSLRYVIIDCSAMTFIDNVGIRILDDIYTSYRKVNISVYMTGPNANVRQMLRQSNFCQENLNRLLFVSIHDAVLAAIDDLDQKSIAASNTPMVVPNGSPCILTSSDHPDPTTFASEDEDTNGAPGAGKPLEMTHQSLTPQ